MLRKWIRCLSALCIAAVLLLSACGAGDRPRENGADSDALTWTAWTGYDDFLALAAETCPDLKVEVDTYAGANRTGYSWIQLREDDSPDIFITSQILDEELAAERLVDLSGCDFVSGFSTTLLDQVSIDGGVYLLPVNNAMYGIFYNKTLMEEHGWELPGSFAELEALCADIREAGLIPGMLGTDLTGSPFSTVFNLAKTSWLSTPEGAGWAQDFLAGKATAAGMWEDTMEYVQKYVDIGMFTTDPEDTYSAGLLLNYLGGRKAVFCTAVMTVNITELPDTGDKLGIMPYISQDGSKNIYMYSPTSYIGLSRRLAEPGNEKKLEDALRLLSLLYSPEGQEVFITEQTPCVLSVLDSAVVAEDSMIYDAQQALREGRAFPMTYAGWEGVLSDMGQAYKDWFRGDNGMDGPGCIARMDELQSGYLSGQDAIYFCESTGSFTLEETCVLVGKALGSAVGADAVLVPMGEAHPTADLRAAVTGKLYPGPINSEVSSTIAPGFDGEYGLASMTGAQIKELAETGFDVSGDGIPIPYVLVTRGGGELEDSAEYQVAFLMQGYTEEAGRTYGVQVEKGSLRAFLRDWLTRQKTASPGGNPWA